MRNEDSAPDSPAPRPSGPAPDWDAIARYLADESPAEEAASVRQWLEANPVDQSLVEKLGAATTFEPMRVDVDAALAKVHAQMEPDRARLVVERGGAWGQNAGTGNRRQKFAIMTLVAALAATFAAFMVTSRRSSEPAVPPQVTTYATAIGKRNSIELADGSRVILGPDSRLTVLGDYGTVNRAVSLEGDAYFDVKHDPKKPFSVRIGRSLIEDIGTTFVVESDAGDTTTVAVISGSVRLRAHDGPATSGEVLSAGDRGSMAADGKVHAYPHTVADDSSWTSGHVVFKDASIARVIGEIRRWYGVELRVTDSSLLKLHVNTAFEGDTPVDQVLKNIGFSLGASVERHGDSATLSAAHGPATVR